MRGNANIFAVPAERGPPFPVTRIVFEEEYNAAPSPDGRLLAFNANDTVRAWRRKGPRTGDAPEIWIVRAGPDAGGHRRITMYPGKDAWPMWAPDGKGLYFVSDEGGADNIWHQSIEDGDRRKIMGFEEGRVTWPAIAARAGVIVFERAFGIRRLAPGGKPEAVPIHAVADEKVGTERKTFTDGATEFAISPDGRKLAFAVHGEIFAMPAGPAEEAAEGPGAAQAAERPGAAEEPPPAFRVTRTAARESGIARLPDSRRIAYSSERGGDPDLYLYDFVMREDFPFIQGLFPDDGLQGIAPMASSPGGRCAWTCPAGPRCSGCIGTGSSPCRRPATATATAGRVPG